MPRASDIDATVPADNVKVDKSDMRANFREARDEINDLFRFTSKAWKIAFGNESV